MTRRARRLATPAVMAVIVCAAVAGTARAHGLSPALLDIDRRPDGRYDVTWAVSAGVSGPVAPRFPARCAADGPARRDRQDVRVIERYVLNCGPDGLAGATVEVAGLSEARTEAVLRVTAGDGGEVTAVLHGDQPRFAVPARADAVTVIGSYVRLGVTHILLGADHLLFVLGLVLLVRRRRDLLVTITAFTVGHSVTLSAAALGVLSAPSAPIEAVIALSIAFLAAELLRAHDADEARSPDTADTADMADTAGAAGAAVAADTIAPRPLRRESRSPRRSPWLVAGGFGLLHGFGFAGALAETGLPASAIPSALLSFNIGVELGQIAFVGAVLALSRAASWTARALPGQWRWSACTRPAAYAMGAVAAFWCIQRIV